MRQLHGRGPVIGRADRAHSPGIRTGVAVVRAFVIARRRQQAKVFAAHEGMDRTFRAAEKFLHHDTPPGLAEAADVHHFVDRRRRFIAGPRNNNAFSERESVGFDHDRELQSLAEALHIAALAESAGQRRRDVRVPHHLLRENLG